MSIKDTENGFYNRTLLSNTFFYVIYESNGTFTKTSPFCRSQNVFTLEAINTFGIVLVGPMEL